MPWNPFGLFQEDPEIQRLLEAIKNRPQTPPRILRLFPSKVTIRRLEVPNPPEATPHRRPISPPRPSTRRL